MKLIDELRQCGEWFELLKPVHDKIEEIDAFLAKEEAQGKVVLPLRGMRLNALRITPFDSCKALVLGQDPYHGRGRRSGDFQAMGLSFSVPGTVETPPSLKNMYKVLVAGDKEFQVPKHGDLTSWAEQGCLLLNTSLTVIEGNPGSHSKIGWQEVTNLIVSLLNSKEQPIVALSWGKHAHKVTELLDDGRHFVYKTSHPSPLGARKHGADFISFMESDCFLKANAWLEQKGVPPIKWQN